MSEFQQAGRDRFDLKSIDLDEAGNLVDRVLHPVQTADSMLEILGY